MLITAIHSGDFISGFFSRKVLLKCTLSWSALCPFSSTLRAGMKWIHLDSLHALGQFNEKDGKKSITSWNCILKTLISLSENRVGSRSIKHCGRYGDETGDIVQDMETRHCGGGATISHTSFTCLIGHQLLAAGYHETQLPGSPRRR